MRKSEFTKNEVQKFQGFKELCSESFKFKCSNCGTLDTKSEQLKDNNICVGCGGNKFIRTCSRCDLPVSLVENSSNHPCNSIKIYNDSSRIIFYDEMMIEIAKLKKKNASKKAVVIHNNSNKSQKKPEEMVSPSKVFVPKIDEKEKQIYINEKNDSQNANTKNFSDLSEKIYLMGKIPRSIIKALRRLQEITMFLKRN
jgi:hypothetical protein